MRRIVSVWLPLWPIERLARHEPDALPDGAPLALVENGQHGLRITAINATAAHMGVRTGIALADARAACPMLLSRPAEPARDRAALLKLARWSGRYGPSCNRDGDDGLWIDVTGVAHLFGGEAALLHDLQSRLAAFGVTAHAAIAGTLGAAHALARYGNRLNQRMAGRAHIAPHGGERTALASLPVEALRLDRDTVLLLKRLGLKRTGQLYDLPRPALERRFSSEASSKSKARDAAHLAGAVLVRLDQALGERQEPHAPLREAPQLSRRRTWSEPLISSESLENEIAALAGELARTLEERGLGCRRLRLTLYRADGSVAEASAGLSRASRDPAHMMRLLGEKLGSIDAGFGIDIAALDALTIEPLGTRQTTLRQQQERGSGPEIAALVDRLANRLGSARITCLAPGESHIPERTEQRVAMHSGRPATGAPRTHEEKRVPGGARPPFLLSPPEPIVVMAEVPEGPPRHFTWRRIRHRIAKAQGPERIAPEWWHTLSTAPPPQKAEAGGSNPEAHRDRPRDYYAVEDEAGARFWLFREGLYQSVAEEGAPRWFLHGLFG